MYAQTNLPCGRRLKLQVLAVVADPKVRPRRKRLVVGRTRTSPYRSDIVGSVARFLRPARDTMRAGPFKNRPPPLHKLALPACPLPFSAVCSHCTSASSSLSPRHTFQNAPRKHVRLAFEAIRPVLLSQLLSARKMSVSRPQLCSPAVSDHFSYSRKFYLLSIRPHPLRLLRLLQSQDSLRGRRNPLSDLRGRRTARPSPRL